MKLKKFKEEYDDLTEKCNDEIEQAIKEKAKDGNTKLLKFWAKTKMKHRGFIEKTEVEYSGSVDHKINPEQIKKSEEHIRKILNIPNEDKS